jgi:beta-lactamase superfamily II metal-dependent hydrolase
MYQVGFGDCLLLSFEYGAALADGRSERHMLFDCGSTHKPWPGFEMTQVTDLIQQHTGGELDVLVSTHRHRDHVSGFGGSATDDAFAAMAPKLVVQAWTEHPDIDKDAIEPAFGARGASVAQMRADAQAMSQLAERILSWVEGLGADAQSQRRYRMLYDLAADQIPNKAAVDNLKKWSEGGKGHYVHFGSGHEQLEDAVPGVGFKVIGPPTLKQHPQLRSYADTSDEYWIAAAREVGATLEPHPPAPSPISERGRNAARARSTASGVRIPITAMPIVERLRDSNAESLLNIVRRMDNFLNNTSVILLIQAGNKRLLFGGDAQIENWGYAQTQPVWDELKTVDLYKVGHHGSRNATPRSLMNLWPVAANASEPRMVALMSTQQGAHGDDENESEVPRGPLVDALKQRATVFSTEALPQGQLWLEVEADLSASGPFRLVPPS